MSFKPNSSSPAPLPVNSQETWLVSAVGPGSRGLPAGGGGGVPSPGPVAQPLPRPLFSDYGPPSLGYLSVAGGGPQQPPQSKYAELLAVIEELGRDIRPTYAGSKSATERLKRGIMHARALVRECLAETERSARS